MLSNRIIVLSLVAYTLAGCLQASKVETAAVPQPPPAEAPQSPPRRDEATELSEEKTKSEPSASLGLSAKKLSAVAAPPPGGMPQGMQALNTESYRYLKANAFLRPVEKPLSTFSADVDTASYANVRRFLLGGALPPADAVRIEELVNYFPYRYQEPSGSEPFGVRLDMAAAPWNPKHRLVRIGIKSRCIDWQARKPANLVFLVDVSGSMAEAKKLPLVIESLQLLAEQLRDDDSISIAVYAGASGLVLPPTPGSRKPEIIDALSRLTAGGSTNGGAGITLAYQIAKENFIRGGINRVILATDGDFNVGVTGEGDLLRLVQDNAKSGVFLTVLGFGMGNYKDSALELLADNGNGTYGYIDSRHEARKLFVEQVGGTLQTVAKDVKLQVEFNPAAVEAYRLIGYENRLLQDHEFNDDRVDAGDVGAGHTVTALYEIIPVGAAAPTPKTDPLKYQLPNRKARAETDEVLTLKIRYKEPDGEQSRLSSYTLNDTKQTLAKADDEFRFAAAVATWGMLLANSPHKAQANYSMVLELAKGVQGAHMEGHRAEFISLVHKANGLSQSAQR